MQMQNVDFNINNPPRVDLIVQVRITRIGQIRVWVAQRLVNLAARLLAGVTVVPE